MNRISSMREGLARPGRPYYGWVIVTICVTAAAVMLGARYSFGVFFTSIEQEYVLNRGATSIIFSVYMLVCSVVALPTGWALDRYGPRTVTAIMGLLTAISLAATSQTTAFWQLLISYSFMLAFGTAGIYATQVAVISRWFLKKRGLALGIGGVGSGLGTFVMSPVIAVLIASVGWRSTYLVLGALALGIVVPLAMLLKRDPSVMGLEPDGGTSDSARATAGGPRGTPRPGHTLRQALRARSFWSVWLSYFSTAVCIHMVTTHIVPRSLDLGLSPALAAGVLSAAGGTSIAGRVWAGRTSDLRGRKLVSVASGLLATVSMLWLPWAGDAWGLYAFGLVFGLAWGGIVTMVTAIMGDFFGTAHLGTIMGVTSIAWVTGAAAGPALGGYLFDAVGSYGPAFLVGAAAMAVSTGLMVSLKS